MRRRDFIAALGGAAAWPLAARAQPAPPVIGLLGSSTAEAWVPLLGDFRRGLREAGYTENSNVAIEYRWAEGRYDRLPALAAELVERRVSVIVAFTTPAARAAKAVTTTIPVVFTTIGDPVQTGLVDSLSRPGRNLTGAAHLNVEIAPKLLEILREAVPGARSMALIVNPNGPNAEPTLISIRTVAESFGIALHVLRVSTERDLDSAFAALAQLRVGGLVIGADAFLHSRSEQLAAWALRVGLPTIYPQRSFPLAGGLMSYAGSNSDGYHQAGLYAGRILKGEKPGDLPVHQSAKVELVINLRTAKALGLDMPPTLLARADEVIE